jgi:NADH-quinone oxidoreductase subunit C
MTNELLVQKIQAIQPTAESKIGFEYVETFIPLNDQHQFLLELKNNPDLAFDYLFCLTGADFSDHLQVIYHLESTKHQQVIVVKVKTSNRENPVVQSVSDIWPTAESHENEVFDLLGITFTNHPEPRRLFLDENWGFPLRKDYQDDVHVITR